MTPRTSAGTGTTTGAAAATTGAAATIGAAATTGVVTTTTVARAGTEAGLGRRLSPAALACIFIFGATVFHGAMVVDFERLLGRVSNSLRASSRDGTRAERADLAKVVSNWTEMTGVAARARSLLLDLVLAEAPEDAAAIEQAVSALAEAAPTSVATWQALAEVRRSRDAPLAKVLDAFRMSALTGSHEGKFMVERAVFGLEHWSELPDADRRTVVRDLLGGLGSEPIAGQRNREILRDRAVLAAKSEAERENIRAALMRSGAPDAVLKALGL